jgi:hypothetical protein
LTVSSGLNSVSAIPFPVRSPLSLLHVYSIIKVMCYSFVVRLWPAISHFSFSNHKHRSESVTLSLVMVTTARELKTWLGAFK